MKTFTLLALALTLSLSYAFIPSSQTGYPNVIFHGIGDSCNFPGMGEFTKNISNLTGAYTLCVPLGSDQSTFSWFTMLDTQGSEACSIIHNDTNLQGTINVIGLSQGGVLARYIIEKCGLAGRVSKFLSIAGPQMGTNSFPKCAQKSAGCDLVNGLTRDMVYTNVIQKEVAPAGYFKDMKKYTQYLQFSSFLADLNNEKTDSQNQTYATLMKELDGVMLVMFLNDTVLDPPQTAWFSYYDVNGTVVPMEQQEIYTDDWIGLRTLDEQGKVKMVALPGDHLSFTNADIVNTFVPFLLS